MRRQSYVQQTAAQLEGLRPQLHGLRDEVFEHSNRFNGEERRQLEVLRDQYQRARWHFCTLVAADDWKELKPEMDRLLEGLERGLTEARASRQARV